MGTMTISPSGAPQIGTQEVLFRLLPANMNVTTDQPFVPLFTFTSYRIVSIVATNASTSLSLAVGGIYTAASKGGAPIVAAIQAYSALTTASALTTLTLANTPLFTNVTPILSLTTAQGGAATATITIEGIAYS